MKLLLVGDTYFHPRLLDVTLKISRRQWIYQLFFKIYDKHIKCPLCIIFSLVSCLLLISGFRLWLWWCTERNVVNFVLKTSCYIFFLFSGQRGCFNTDILIYSLSPTQLLIKCSVFGMPRICIQLSVYAGQYRDQKC